VKLAQRIFLEKRSILLPLALALLANIGVYAAVVYPLAVRSANAADRAAAAALSLRAAEREVVSARALVTGKSLADEELATFYRDVLPADLSAAVHMTYTWVPALARKTRLKYQARNIEREVVKEQGKEPRLARLKSHVVLQGDYEAVRQFVYELETATEFVIIDDVTLAQGEADKPLSVILELSTYFRLGADGT